MSSSVANNQHQSSTDPTVDPSISKIEIDITFSKKKIRSENEPTFRLHQKIDKKIEKKIEKNYFWLKVVCTE